MPKSKVRKKTDYTINPANRTPVKVKVGPITAQFKGQASFAWLIVYYLAADQITWMNDLGAYNFLIGFGFMVVGLIMTMRWR